MYIYILSGEIWRIFLVLLDTGLHVPQYLHSETLHNYLCYMFFNSTNIRQLRIIPFIPISLYGSLHLLSPDTPQRTLNLEALTRFSQIRFNRDGLRMRLVYGIA